MKLPFQSISPARTCALLAVANMVLIGSRLLRDRASVVRLDRETRDFIRAEISSGLHGWAMEADRRLSAVRGSSSDSRSQSSGDSPAPFDAPVPVGWSFGSDGRPFVVADGAVLRVGDWCEYGRIERIGRRVCDCRGINGARVVCILAQNGGINNARNCD